MDGLEREKKKAKEKKKSERKTTRRFLKESKTIKTMSSSSMMMKIIRSLIFTLLVIPNCLFFPKYASTTTSAFSLNEAFSLSEYQRACAVETSKSLDASRLHLQVLFVDDDNAMGRISEGLLERVAEYNDALFVLYPASATINSVKHPAPIDAAAPPAALQVCDQLGLDSAKSTAMGTAFDLSYLDGSDLIIVMDDDVRQTILRSLPSIEDQEHYAPRCRLLSEFLSPAFSMMKNGNSSDENNHDSNNLQLLDVLDPELNEFVAPVADQVLGSSSSIFTSDQKIAALILASAGLTRFCLDTIDAQLEEHFQLLLEKNFKRRDQLPSTWKQADAQLTRCCASVTGYFSPKQRQTRIEQHMDNLRRCIDK